MKRHILLILILLPTALTYGQERLEPVAFASEYDHSCIEKLTHRTYYVFYMRQPSFSAESALSLHKGRLTYITAGENIWYAKKRNHVKTTTYEMAVADSVAWQIHDVIIHAINTASPWADPRMITDGIGYYFCNRHQGAWTHSPDSGARAFLLAEAMDSICLAVVHSDTALLLRQMPMLDSLDRCFRMDYPLEAFHPDIGPWTYTDSTGVAHLRFYRNDCFMNIVAADSADAAARMPSMLDFYQQLSREVFIRYPDGVKLSVMVDPTCTDPRCKVVTHERYNYTSKPTITNYTLTIPPAMLTLERSIGALELPEGTHHIR